jgi:hypothetical protein
MGAAIRISLFQIVSNPPPGGFTGWQIESIAINGLQ